MVTVRYLRADDDAILIHQKIGEKSGAALEVWIEMRVDFENCPIFHQID